MRSPHAGFWCLGFDVIKLTLFYFSREHARRSCSCLKCGAACYEQHGRLQDSMSDIVALAAVKMAPRRSGIR